MIHLNLNNDIRERKFNIWASVIIIIRYYMLYSYAKLKALPVWKGKSDKVVPKVKGF